MEHILEIIGNVIGNNLANWSANRDMKAKVDLDIFKNDIVNELKNLLKDYEIKGDLKFGDLFSAIETNQTIKLVESSGESFYPKLSDLENYKDYPVADIFTHNSNLVIRLSDSIQDQYQLTGED